MGNNRLPWNSDSAQHYPGIRAEAEPAGTPIGNTDIMTAKLVS